MDIAAGRLHIGRVSLVVLHIARSLEFVKIVFAFELLKQFFRRFAENVDENIDSAAVRHANDNLLDAGYTTLLNHVIEHWDETFTTLK